MAAQTRSDWVYFIVTPDPNIPGSHLTRDGTEGFFIKFGDGDPRHRYQTNNPSFGVAINTCCPTHTLLTTIQDNDMYSGASVARPRRGGKFLEHHYLKSHSWEANTSEWWWVAVQQVRLNPTFTVDTLRTHLCTILRAFPSHDKWDAGAGNQQLDQSTLMLIWWHKLAGNISLSPSMPAFQSTAIRPAPITYSDQDGDCDSGWPVNMPGF